MQKNTNTNPVHIINIYEEARSHLESGALLCYPTETFYAIGCYITSPLKPTIYAIKKRSLEKRLPIIASSVEQIETFAKLCPLEKEVLSCFPALTLIVDGHTSSRAEKDNTIATRIASTPFLTYITEVAPIVSTSANMSGEPPASRSEHIDASLLVHASIYIPTNPKDMPAGKISSTIVRIVGSTLHIKRVGTTTQATLEKAGFTILLAC